MKIAILSSSVRVGRASHRVALFFERYIKEHALADAEILDLYEYQFPIFNERLRLMKDPTAEVLEFAEDIITADGVIIVTPEYNGSIPASLKNVIDLLFAEWKRKPIAIATVSSGPFAGSQAMTQVMVPLWRVGALIVPAMFRVAKVSESYDEHGNATDKAASEKSAKGFLDELLWCMEAKRKMGNEMKL